MQLFKAKGLTPEEFSMIQLNDNTTLNKTLFLNLTTEELYNINDHKFSEYAENSIITDNEIHENFSIIIRTIRI